MKFYSTTKTKESCILIGVIAPHNKTSHVQENLEELSALVLTAGGMVQEKFIQSRETLNPAYFIGKGKAREISLYIEEHEIDTVIFDDELTPAQIRNWEQLTSTKVIDRSALILDIFAAHARTREARTQVELAQLNYYLPRLSQQWTHLSRQVGGIGTKGPGETQLETDRRIVRARIAHLKQDLDKIKNQSITQRKKSKDLIKVALVGYTNAGKSSLMNALTNAGIHVADKLFATLDTTVRRLELSRDKTVLISDTVGFIRKLPHHLIASFQTTLAQTIEADILLHVVDLSNHVYEDHVKVVQGVLKDLQIDTKPTFLIMNKVDRIENQEIIQRAKAKYSDAIFISAQKRIRISRISQAILNFLDNKNNNMIIV